MELNVANVGNIMDQCFACLGKTDFNEDISKNEEIQTLFKTTFNIEIETDKESPKYLCQICDQKLKAASEFLQQIRNCIQYIVDYKNYHERLQQDIKLEEHIELEIEDNEVRDDSESNAETDSENEPLIRLAKKKRKKRKLKKFPLEEVEKALDEYKKEFEVVADCIVCDFKGLSIRNLSCHMIHKHRNEKNVWCSKCNKFFDDLEEHQKIHRNNVWCRFCSKDVTRVHYMEHLKNHAVFQYPCKKCQKKFISQKALDRHMLQHNRNNKPFQCPNCTKSFKLLKSLEDHINLHGRYTCENCKKHFEIPELLSSHLCSANNSENDFIGIDENDGDTKELDITCENVNGSNTSNQNIVESCENEDETKQQVLEVESEDIKQLMLPNIKIKKIESLNCHICGKNYKTVYKLQKHIEAHMGIFSATCKYCGKGFTCKSDLINHERVHTKEKPFICSECGKGFVSSATLRIHVIQHKGKPEECELCHKRFCRKSELKLHLQKHRGERPFLCNDCGKSFAQKSHLTCHITMHTEERPYACTQCDKTFKKKDLLKLHMRLHGEKKFKCSVCFYECHKNYRLQQHMKMHAGKTNLKIKTCQLCMRTFSSLALLNGHMSSVHSVIV